MRETGIDEGEQTEKIGIAGAVAAACRGRLTRSAFKCEAARARELKDAERVE